MFNLEKAHYILNEMIMCGYIIETNKALILSNLAPCFCAFSRSATLKLPVLKQMKINYNFLVALIKYLEFGNLIPFCRGSFPIGTHQISKL